MEIVRLQKRVLQPAFNGYLLLAYDYLIGLVKAKLSLRDLGDVDSSLL